MESAEKGSYLLGGCRGCRGCPEIEEAKLQSGLGIADCRTRLHLSGFHVLVCQSICGRAGVH